MCFKDSLNQIWLNFRRLKGVFSQQKLKVVKGKFSKDYWVWLSTNRMNPNKIHKDYKSF